MFFTVQIQINHSNCQNCIQNWSILIAYNLSFKYKDSKYDWVKIDLEKNVDFFTWEL